jgi:hypothetical protein
MSPRIRYEGPGHRLAAYGKIVARGDEATFTDAEAQSLLAQRYIRFSVDGVPHVPPPAGPNSDRFDVASRPSAHGSRRQWSAYASARGVQVTDEMTRDEIVAALETHTAPSGAGEPEAQTGEGQLPDTKEN